jgi:Flp pilus assembly protein TadG
MVGWAKALKMKMDRTRPLRARALIRRRRVTGVAGDQSGAAAVEFGLIAPALLMILMAIIQFGLVLNNYLELTDAVRVAARSFAIAANGTTPMTSATSAATASAANLTSANITLTYTVNGAACTTDAACATALAADSGLSATVTGTYPCSLTIMAVNFASGCTLTSTTADMVE